ncbi:ydg sra domain-containing protein [Colletotrichum kahawae]|uniref:Ydg sra domain-containing protein n=1 Tax=Colletotrichum kahawae TaxID=34407 RepID=A0AAD9Y0J1_COLKA|nr:ydg sra domain-containing protein [Colletotrichum kahawae]
MAPSASKLVGGTGSGHGTSNGPKVPGPGNDNQLSTCLYNLRNTIVRIGMMSRINKPIDHSSVITLKKEIYDFFNYLEACQDYFDMSITTGQAKCQGDLTARLLSISDGEPPEKQRLFTTGDKSRALSLRQWIDDSVLAKRIVDPKTVNQETHDEIPDTSSFIAVVDDIPRPPAEHPIWGVRGIMHGLTIIGIHVRFNPDYKHLRRQAKEYGHNDLKAGIHGNITGGAYSVVISPTSGSTDIDNGDVVWYSGSGSEKNRDFEKVPKRTAGTKALAASLTTGNMVRVLRAAPCKGKQRLFKHAPNVGFRYDGLYQVKLVTNSVNKLGGRIEQFKLVRCEDQDQPDLEELRSIPNPDQQNAHEKILEKW